MIRLTLLLCTALFVGLLLGGEDRGQLRFGLAGAYDTDPAPAVLAEEASVEVAMEASLSPASIPAADVPVAEPVVFTPTQPVMAAPVVEVAEPEVVATVEADIPADEAPLVWYVDSKSVNVRAGPSTNDQVVGRLPRGEAVLVLASEPGPDGWTQVRIEGDGVEGYIATRLLKPTGP